MDTLYDWPEKEEYLRRLGAVILSAQFSKKKKKLTLDRGIEELVSLLLRLRKTKNKLMIVGNGGSSAIASHEATDTTKNGGIRAVSFTDGALLTCFANDFGYENAFAEMVNRFADKGDVLIAISSSGKSPNIIRAVQSAQKKGCTTVTFSAFSPENPLRAVGDMQVYVPSATGGYGFAEISHLAIIHCALETFIGRANKNKKKKK